MKSALGAYHTQLQALSRYFVGSILQTDSVLDVIRRELRRVSPDVKIDNEEIRQVLVNEVLKRDVVEGEKATEASKKITKASQRLLRALPKPAGSKVIDSSQSNSVDDTTTKS